MFCIFGSHANKKMFLAYKVEEKFIFDSLVYFPFKSIYSKMNHLLNIKDQSENILLIQFGN